jgi:hypothetical protein
MMIDVVVELVWLVWKVFVIVGLMVEWLMVMKKEEEV